MWYACLPGDLTGVWYACLPGDLTGVCYACLPGDLTETVRLNEGRSNAYLIHLFQRSLRPTDKIARSLVHLGTPNTGHIFYV